MSKLDQVKNLVTGFWKYEDLDYQRADEQAIELMQKHGKWIIEQIEKLQDENTELAVVNQILVKENKTLINAVDGSRVICNIATDEKQKAENQSEFYKKSIQKAVANFNNDEHQEGMARLLLALEVSK